MNVITTIQTSAAFRLVLLCVLLGAGAAASYGQLRLTRVSFSDGRQIDVSAYPKVRVRVRATLDNNPISLQPNNFSLLQLNQALPPEVVTVEANGVHVIEWTSSQFGLLSVSLIAASNGQTSIVSYFEQVGKAVGGRVIVRDSMSRNVPLFLDFETVEPGGSDTMKLKLVATEAALENGLERRIMLEDLSIDNPRFKIIWRNTFNTPPPPVLILSPSQYRFDLVFEPTDDTPQFGVITATFEGGMKSDVMVTGNPRSYPRRTILTVTSPNGGEAFAPCQEVPIRWKGAIAGFRAFVEYSTNNGRRWNVIDSTLDSTLVWTVPNTVSDSMLIRVSQKFQSTSSEWLQGEQAPALDAAYSADGRFVSVGYAGGVILEWDLVDRKPPIRKTIPGLGSNNIRAITYVGNSRSIIVASAGSGSGGILSLILDGSSTSTNSVAIDFDINVRDLGTDTNGETLWVLPQLSGRIPSYDPTTLAEKQAIVLTSAASTSSINANTISVSQLDGEIVQYSAVDASELARSQTNITPLRGPTSFRMTSSVDGRLVALAGLRLTGVENGDGEQRTFIYDMQENEIVKILFRESSDVQSMSISPSNAFLGLGYAFNPQFIVYDLVNSRTLPPSGSAAGHKNRLTDLAFSPDGSTLVSTSVDQTENVLLRKVSIPEVDISDAAFSIAPVELTISRIDIPEALIGTTNTIAANASVCNTGRVPAIISSSGLTQGEWLSIATSINGDTVLPGECLRLQLQSVPNDTGLLIDSVRLEFCGEVFYVPTQQPVRDRNLEILTPVVDFGDLCAGETDQRRIPLFVNRDPVDVEIDAVFVVGGLGAQFRITDQIEDEVVAPNDTLFVTVEFNPTRIGFDTAQVNIRYENQTNVQRTIIATGRGSGANVRLSHRQLPFIPEINQRTVWVRNDAPNPITIDSTIMSNGAPFSVATQTPLVVNSGDSVEITINFLGGPIPGDANVVLAIKPCSGAHRIELMPYASSSVVMVPTVVTDSRNDTASIPIWATINETIPYDGTRFFEGALEVDSRLYLAESIQTSIGTARILNQDVVGRKRTISFRVDGRFEGELEIARIVGYAGMAEVDASDLTFSSSALSFGSADTTSYVNGLLVITHRDPIRRIIQPSGGLIIGNVFPAPSSDIVEIELSSFTKQSMNVVVISAAGETVMSVNDVEIQQGESSVSLNVGSLPSGPYTISFVGQHHVASTPLQVIR